jgi:hypothetical protein
MALFRHKVERQHGETEKAGKNHDQRHDHLEIGGDDGRQLRGAQVFGGHGALHDEKVCGPVSARDGAAEAEDDSGPVHAHGVAGESAERAPEMDVVVAVHLLEDARFEAAPAADFHHAENWNDERAEPDEKELQHLIEDGGIQTAERDVNGDGERRDPDAEVNVPAQNDLHHDGHGIHIDARHEDGHEGEGDAAQGARASP